MLRTLLREHLIQQLGAIVVAEYSSMKFLSEEAADLESIDLFLIDADLPDQSPLPGIRTLLARRPTAKAALITDVPGAYLAECTVQLRLRGLLNKRDNLDSLVAAVKSVLAGGLWISPQIDLTGRAEHGRHAQTQPHANALYSLPLGTSPARPFKRPRFNGPTLHDLAVARARDIILGDFGLTPSD